ncbi:MAG: hydroxyacylglutathione hydrolase [Verrucomicrobia bacterium]|nr:hydroxyacylglutathione hydrolase [Verrucomicrobiota bacterium]
MNVAVIPVLADNYAFLMTTDDEAAVIDPGEAAPILEAFRSCTVPIKSIWITHNHMDHVAGCRDLQAATRAKILAPAEDGLPGVDRTLHTGDTVRLGRHSFSVLSTPGHTTEHVAYYSEREGILFCGDVLFAGGCGRVMASTADVLWASLTRLRDLPDATRIYCGHEYTVNNLAFAMSLEPDNSAVAERLKLAEACISRGEPTVPSTLAEEKATNPFLRADTPAMQQVVNMPGASGADVFAALRLLKDQW